MSAEKTRDPRIDGLLEALEGGLSLNEAAARIGVSSRQVRRWRAADAELEAAVREAMSDADDQVEAVTLGNCLDPDPAHNTLRMFWLKSRRPQVYQDKVSQSHSGGLRIVVEYADANPDAPPAPPGPEGDPL